MGVDVQTMKLRGSLVCMVTMSVRIGIEKSRGIGS